MLIIGLKNISAIIIYKFYVQKSDVSKAYVVNFSTIWNDGVCCHSSLIEGSLVLQSSGPWWMI